MTEKGPAGDINDVTCLIRKWGINVKVKLFDQDDRVDDRPGLRVIAGRIAIYPERFEVFVQDQRVPLTLTQFKMLSFMAKRPGWVFTPEQFTQSLNLSTHANPAVAIKNHIYAMRQKLGSAGNQIETVRGVGYRLNDDML